MDGTERNPEFAQPKTVESARETIRTMRQAGRARVEGALTKAGTWIDGATKGMREGVGKVGEFVADKSLNAIGDMLAGKDLKTAKAELTKLLSAERAKVNAAKAEVKRLKAEAAKEWRRNFVKNLGPNTLALGAAVGIGIGEVLKRSHEERRQRDQEFARKWNTGIDTFRLNAAEKKERLAIEKARAIREKMGILDLVHEV